MQTAALNIAPSLPRSLSLPIFDTRPRPGLSFAADPFSLGLMR